MLTDMRAASDPARLEPPSGPDAPTPPSAPTPPRAPSPPRRRSREERRAETRERLLDAAAVVFNRLGYHAATLEAVADAAGYTKGAVYSNFATKQDLFLALVERDSEARVGATEAALGAVSFEQAIALAPDALRRQAAADEVRDVLSIEFWLAAMRDPALRERLAIANREALARYGKVMDERVRRAGIEPGFTGSQLAQLANAFTSGLLLQYYLDPEGTDLDAAVRALRRIAGLPDDDVGAGKQARASAGPTAEGRAVPPR
jgi:AcrR family transcriptional regulator